MSFASAEQCRRIIEGFSALEREIFLAMGGTLPAVTPKPEPIVWRQPNTLEDGERESQVKRKNDAVRKKKERMKRKHRRKPLLMAAGAVKAGRRGRAA